MSITSPSNKVNKIQIETESLHTDKLMNIPNKSPTSPATVHITEPLPISSPKRRSIERHERSFASSLSTPIIDIEKLRENARMGIPFKYRPTVWRIFMEYEPISREFSLSTLTYKRKDYFSCLERIYGQNQQSLWTSAQKSIIHQILIDLPRTPYKILKDNRVKKLFEHVLFVWAVRHPASGYVQGMNDILLPFFIVFISQYFPSFNSNCFFDMDNVSSISDNDLCNVEADCYWCFSKLLDEIQDSFTKDQPGLFRMIDMLKDVVEKADPSLSRTISQQGVQYMQFSIEWMNCLFVREFSMNCLLRVWDLYLSQVSQIGHTHVYVCASLLTYLSPKLINLNQMEFILYLQSMGPDKWSSDDIETILAQAYIYQNKYKE